MLEEATRLQPRVAHYLNALSNAYAAVGHVPQSLSTARRALKANKQIGIGHETLAQACIDANRYDEALNVLQTATRLEVFRDPEVNLGAPLRRLISAAMRDAALKQRVWQPLWGMARQWVAVHYTPQLPWDFEGSGSG